MFLDFIEIGTSDFWTEISAATAQTRGLSIEPIKYYLDRLPDKPHCKKINCAISNREGEIDIFFVPMDRIVSLKLPTWMRGCNSVEKQHPTVVNELLKRGIDPEQAISKECVQVKKIGSVLQEYGVIGVKYLKIDTEGHDCIIMNDYLDFCEENPSLLPYKIKFESNVLVNEQDVRSVQHRLIQLDYVLEESSGNTVMSRRVSTIFPRQYPEIPITCVLLNWKRLDNIKFIIQKLKKRQYITEIIVWNNNPSPIVHHQIGVHNQDAVVKIVNSKQNLCDEAKYRGALMAKNEHVFYQDDDFMTAPYLDAMYRTFCLNPDRLHIAVGEMSYVTTFLRSYYNHALGLQAEFCFIGTGAMFPKSIAKKYLEYLEKYFDDKEKLFADYGFSLMTNQPFVKLQVRLASLSQEEAFSNESIFKETSRKTHKKVVSDLLSKTTQPYFGLPRAVARSVYADRILFSTFLPAELNHYDQIYNPDNPSHAAARMEPPHEVNKAVTEYRYNCFHSAIKDDPNASWHVSINSGEYFGLWLLKKMFIQCHFSSLDQKINDNDEWLVTVDGFSHMLTFLQLSTLKVAVENELKIKCMHSTPVLGIKFYFEDIAVSS